MTNVEHFEKSQTGEVLTGLRTNPECRSTNFFLEDETLNLVLQLLLSKDELIVRTVLNFVAKIFRKTALIQIICGHPTFFERIVYAGLKTGNGRVAANVFCNFLKKMGEDQIKHEVELKDLERLFPYYIINMLKANSASECEFLFNEIEKVDTRIYWTKELFVQLKETIDQFFAVDLYNLDEYYSGKKKNFPKARVPSAKVQVYYEIPKDLISVDGLFINILVTNPTTLNFKDQSSAPDTLFNKCMELIGQRLKSKEFSSNDPIVYSDLRSAFRTCLLFIRNKRCKSVAHLESFLGWGEILTQEWVPSI